MGREKILRDITGNVIVSHLETFGGFDMKIAYLFSFENHLRGKGRIINIRTIMPFKQDSFIVYLF